MINKIDKVCEVCEKYNIPQLLVIDSKSITLDYVVTGNSHLLIYQGTNIFGVSTVLEEAVTMLRERLSFYGH